MVRSKYRIEKYVCDMLTITYLHTKNIQVLAKV